MVTAASVACPAYDWRTVHAFPEEGRYRTHGDAPMTETLSQGAANQAGARVDADAYEKAADFLPIDGIDHVEFWVGNAR
jgi:hypothetical protein